MATFYIHRLSKTKYPNVLRRVGANIIYDLTYVGKHGKFEPLGYHRTKGAAIKVAKGYASSKLNSKTVEFKYMKDGKAVR
jgi:hypothetical protein